MIQIKKKNQINSIIDYRGQVLSFRLNTFFGVDLGSINQIQINYLLIPSLIYNNNNFIITLPQTTDEK